jgi:predicted GNAT family acetyltransferase
MPEHPLDRPVWSALTTRWSDLAEGDGRALRLKGDYGIFAAAADPSPESLAALAALVPEAGELASVETDPGWPPVPGVINEVRSVWQMAVVRPPAGEPAAFEIIDLSEADAPKMFELATLTRPGPYRARTHQLGGFVGVRQDGQLIAMAGERMKVPGFTEVSGVCTRPEHRGRGLAGALMRVVMARIEARNETPFLHAYAANTGAIGLYRTLGFELRREVIMTVLTRP